MCQVPQTRSASSCRATGSPTSCTASTYGSIRVIAPASASSLASYSASAGPNSLGGLNKFSRFRFGQPWHCPLRCAHAARPVVPGRSVLATAFDEKNTRRSRVSRLQPSGADFSARKRWVPGCREVLSLRPLDRVAGRAVRSGDTSAMAGYKSQRHRRQLFSADRRGCGATALWFGHESTGRIRFAPSRSWWPTLPSCNFGERG
jgi:hypothetical protein